MPRYVTALVIGLLLGAIGPRYAVLGWLSLIPWGLAGLGLGYWSRRGESVLTGVLYGFALCLAFLIAGYTGRESLVSRLPFFTLLGAFGAVCGLILAVAGFWLKHLIESLVGRKP